MTISWLKKSKTKYTRDCRVIGLFQNVIRSYLSFGQKPPCRLMKGEKLFKTFKIIAMLCQILASIFDQKLKLRDESHGIIHHFRIFQNLPYSSDIIVTNFPVLAFEFQSSNSFFDHSFKTIRYVVHTHKLVKSFM